MTRLDYLKTLDTDRAIEEFMQYVSNCMNDKTSMAFRNYIDKQVSFYTNVDVVMFGLDDFDCDFTFYKPYKIDKVLLLFKQKMEVEVFDRLLQDIKKICSGEVSAVVTFTDAKGYERRYTFRNSYMDTLLMHRGAVI